MPLAKSQIQLSFSGNGERGTNKTRRQSKGMIRCRSHPAHPSGAHISKHFVTLWRHGEKQATGPRAIGRPSPRRGAARRAASADERLRERRGGFWQLRPSRTAPPAALHWIASGDSLPGRGSRAVEEGFRWCGARKTAAGRQRRCRMERPEPVRRM